MFTQETASCKDDADALSSRQYPEGFYIFYVRKRTKTWKYGVRTYNWTWLQNYNLILWMILDCISFVSFFAANQISNPKMPKRRELMGWVLMVEKKPSFFASPMGQASCCYCNCLSMQKSCLTKQTILLLMNAAAVQRCLSFWKSRFYGSFFFENRKLINYFCFTYLPAISFLQILSSSSFWF